MTLHIFGVWSPKKKKKKKAKLYKEAQTSGASGVRRRRRRRGAGLNRGGWLSRVVDGKGLFCLLVAGDIKVKIQSRVGINNPPLESKPSGSPLSAGLIPQTRYRSVPLNNQSFLPLKVPSQPMTLIGQAFNRAHSFRSFATGSILQCCFITQLI